jgi:3',5'-cyclic-nucleotide phosphodiesterase
MSVLLKISPKGSGQGALNQILKRQPDLFSSSSDSAIYSPADIYSFVRCVRALYTSRCPVSGANKICQLLSNHARPFGSCQQVRQLAALVLDLPDPITSLVISAGSLRGPRKRVYAAEETLKDLESVFADRLWPNLASWKEEDEAFKLLYTTSVASIPPLVYRTNIRFYHAAYLQIRYTLPYSQMSPSVWYPSITA